MKNSYKMANDCGTLLARKTLTILVDKFALKKQHFIFIINIHFSLEIF